MRSSEQLPLPGAWRPVSESLVLSAICAPVLVLVLFVLRPAVSTLGTPLWAAGAATLVAGLSVLIGAYGIVRSRWRMSGTRAFGIDEKAGTTLVRYSREFLFLRIVALASLTPQPCSGCSGHSPWPSLSPHPLCCCSLSASRPSHGSSCGGYAGFAWGR